MMRDQGTREREVVVRAGEVSLEGHLGIPERARAIVVFAHGSGSSRHSPRNNAVAGALNEGGLATLLFDLLTPEEDEVDRRTRELRFDIGLLADRLTGALDWLPEDEEAAALPIGLFGSSTGSAAALLAAARRPEAVGAVVSRGGRPDLAQEALPEVRAPVLLIVGGEDRPVIRMNEDAREAMRTRCTLEVVAGATHLFEEPGKLEEVSSLAREFFLSHLGGPP